MISYRLRKAGVTHRGFKNTISPSRVRALRDNFGTLEDLRCYLERRRSDLLARMGDNPSAKTLDHLGELTDFINVMQEITQ